MRLPGFPTAVIYPYSATPVDRLGTVIVCNARCANEAHAFIIDELTDSQIAAEEYAICASPNCQRLIIALGELTGDHTEAPQEGE